MSTFDILVLVVALGGAVLGFRRGFIAQAGQIIAFVLGIMACRMFGPAVAAWLGSTTDSATTDTAIAYAITYVGAYVAVLVVVRLVRGVVSAVHLGVFDRLGGAALKAGLWLFMLSIALNVWAAVIPGSDLTDTQRHPRRAYVLKIAPAVCGYVMEKARTNTHTDCKNSDND